MDDVTDACGNQKCNVHKFLSKLFKILKVGIYANFGERKVSGRDQIVEILHLTQRVNPPNFYFLIFTDCAVITLLSDYVLDCGFRR